MTKRHAYVAHVPKHVNMVGGPGPGPLAPLKSGVDIYISK